METPLLRVTNVHLLISTLLFLALLRVWRADRGGVVPFVLGVCSAEELLQLLLHVDLRHHLLLLPFCSALRRGAP